MSKKIFDMGKNIHKLDTIEFLTIPSPTKEEIDLYDPIKQLVIYAFMINENLLKDKEK